MKQTLTAPVGNMLSELYEEDETAWLEHSVQLIKDGRYDSLDYPNLIDFLESMAKRDRKEVRSRLVTLIVHLLKWQYQPERRTRSWRRTIINEHRELEFDLQSKTLRNHAADILADVYSRAVKDVAAETGLARGAFPKECPYTLEFLVGDEVVAIIAQK